MTKRQPPPKEPREETDTSYEEAMQARIDRLTENARKMRRRNMLLTTGVCLGLIVVAGVGLLLMRQCGGATGYRDSFRWLKPRRPKRK
jgi:hypothetical protein